MRLFFKINEVRVDLLPQNHEMAIFQTKNGQKWPFMAQIPIFLYGSYVGMLKEYPVHWDALIV